jgi:hypothetical protein
MLVIQTLVIVSRKRSGKETQDDSPVFLGSNLIACEGRRANNDSNHPTSHDRLSRELFSGW